MPLPSPPKKDNYLEIIPIKHIISVPAQTLCPMVSHLSFLCDRFEILTFWVTCSKRH